MAGEGFIMPAGFERVRSCHCGGHYTEIYARGGYELSIRSKKYQFKLKKSGTTIVNWTPLHELHQTIIQSEGQNILT